jgi:hypothetical protein
VKPLHCWFGRHHWCYAFGGKRACLNCPKKQMAIYFGPYDDQRLVWWVSE